MKLLCLLAFCLCLPSLVAAGWKTKCSGEFEVSNKVVYDFEEFDSGDTVRNLENLLISAKRFDSDGNKVKATPMAFDSSAPSGGDVDLKTSGKGMVLIVSTDDNPLDPNDHEEGGLFSFKFEKPAIFNRLNLIDAQDGGVIKVYRADGTRSTYGIPKSADGKKQRFQFGIANVRKIVVRFKSSAAVSLLDVTFCETESAAPSITPSAEPSALPSSVPTSGNRSLTEETFLSASNPHRELAREESTNDSAAKVSPFFRIDAEAVDFKLEWSSMEDTEASQEELLINPSFVFVPGKGGNGVQWVRVARRHTMAHDIWENATFRNRTDIREELLTYHSAIVMSTVPFTGNLSAGFNDSDVVAWGLQEPSNDFAAENLLLVSGSGSPSERNLWNDLCEPKAKYAPEEGVLIRKRVTGPEDPKLFVVPGLSESDEQSIGLTFSSYPPSEGLSMWDDRCVFRMYSSEVIPIENDQHMQAVPKTLSCGEEFSDEKNWIAFHYEDSLHFIYSIEPHVIVKVNNSEGICHQVHNTTFPYLESLSNQVSLRGSGTAVRYNEETFIALIHTYDGHSIEEPYTTLAYKFEAQPPFRILDVSRPLELQSPGLAFASSLVVYEDKVMVGYGVHDRSSRLMVMSRRYFDRQFKSDECEETIFTTVPKTGNSCGQESLSLMLGQSMMSPRRAMVQVAEQQSECLLMADGKCSPQKVLDKVHISPNVTSCGMALSQNAGGDPCNARVKWLVSEENVEVLKAMRIVAEQFEACKPMLDLNCGPEDLHWPNGKITVCNPKIYNDYKKSGPAIMLSIGRAGSGLIRPLMQCLGISTEVHKCQGKLELSFLEDSKRAQECLRKGQFHFVKLHPFMPGGKTAHTAIKWVTGLAANLGNRTGYEVPKVITMVRDPLRVVFAWLEAEVGGLNAPSKTTVKNYQTRINRTQFTSLASTMEGHEFIMNSIRRNAGDHVKDWDVIKSVILDPSYDTLMVTGEELRSRTIRPALLAALSQHVLGNTSKQEAIYQSIQTVDTVYSSKVDAKNENLMSFEDFYLYPSVEGMQYICHLIQEVPEMVRAIAEQNYKEGFAKMVAFCPGFEEAWLENMVDPIFIGLTEAR